MAKPEHALHALNRGRRSPSSGARGRSQGGEAEGRGQRVGAEGVGIEGGARVGQREAGSSGEGEPVRRPDRREWAWSKGLGPIEEVGREDQDAVQKEVWST